MVYFGKKQGTGPLPANTATTDGNNTFTGNNTFNNAITTTGLTSSNNGDISISPNGTGRIQAQADILMNNHYIAGLATPNSNQDAANKEYVDNQVATCAKLASDNTFTANNTFNNAIVAGGTTAIKKAGSELTAVEMTDQGSKTIHFDFIQPSGSFRNYCSIDFRIKQDSGTFQNGLKIEARDNASGLVYSTDCAFYQYDNKEIRGLATPTQNDSAATKSYVDGIIKQKEIVLSSAQWKNTINSKIRVYGWTTSLTAQQKDNVLGVELVVNANWDQTGNNSYICTFAKYGGDEFKVFVSRYDGQNITDATLDACSIKIRYVDNITTV